MRSTTDATTNISTLSAVTWTTPSLALWSRWTWSTSSTTNGVKTTCIHRSPSLYPHRTAR
ncbi:hypothetical protein E2C01_100189 [Portunus trituberculatus]|uniref:Uncharacterized protein n=1 Tax=Portunus trituberculatus TaxID=210409 RepID=A0A5B7KCC8_PORTR|nr:hypothetical protein [Portunus trituberculatus]